MKHGEIVFHVAGHLRFVSEIVLVMLANRRHRAQDVLGVFCRKLMMSVATMKMALPR